MKYLNIISIMLPLSMLFGCGSGESGNSQGTDTGQVTEETPGCTIDCPPEDSTDQVYADIKQAMELTIDERLAHFKNAFEEKATRAEMFMNSDDLAESPEAVDAIVDIYNLQAEILVVEMKAFILDIYNDYSRNIDTTTYLGDVAAKLFSVKEDLAIYYDQALVLRYNNNNDQLDRLNSKNVVLNISIDIDSMFVEVSTLLGVNN